MNKNIIIATMAFNFLVVFSGTAQSIHNPIKEKIVQAIGFNEIARAKAFLHSVPITVTNEYCERSVGGKNDFYSEGDYWWPNPKDPTGAYIQKDGQSNPDNFTAHRFALIRLSEIVATLTSAWLLTKEQIYADKAQDHLNAWFVDDKTKMNPHMLYAQAVFGKVTGRGIGLIDAYHFVEVAQSAKILSNNGAINFEESTKIKSWFSEFLKWMTTHEYGISEMNWKNNHGTCWAVTAASMATLINDSEVIELCSNRFKEILLPNQMALNGSFPLELERTKPYGYSLFNIDAFFSLAELLSTEENNLFEFETKGGKSLKKGIEYIYPFIKDKSKWPFQKDIYIWNEWPVRHPSVLFASLAYEKESYVDTYLSLPAYPIQNEVIRNLPVRHPIIWIIN